MRRIIVFEVMVLKDSLKNVCDRYRINFSSAKNVIQIYKKEGRLEKKVVKARKAGTKSKNNDSEGSNMEVDEDEEKQSDNDDEPNGMATLAPAEQRCKLDLVLNVEE